MNLAQNVASHILLRYGDECWQVDEAVICFGQLQTSYFRTYTPSNPRAAALFLP